MTTIPTSGQNRKRYLAGALDALCGRILYAEGDSRNTDLFLRLLGTLENVDTTTVRRRYLVLDNYSIQRSHLARAWLPHYPRFRLPFQRTYGPSVNVIERLWKTMHDTGTRNHRY